MCDSYYDDSRVVAGMRQKWYKALDEGKMRALVSIGFNDETGEDIDAEVPFKYEVCPTCNGKGSHVNPSIDAGGLSYDDFENDPDLHSNYFGGVYDVSCYECKGQRVVPCINKEACDKDVLAKIEKQQREEEEFLWLQRAEMSMGA